MSNRKVVVIGLDSMTPTMVDRFMAEGCMPNLQRLMERGWSSEITPTMPPTTPAGWTTIATGAWPSTHGIEGFAVHVEGEPLDKKNHACTAARIKAETIWQAAERAGKRTILLKYPMSWPPLGGDLVLQVDGAGGWGGLKCVWDLVHSACWDTHATGPETNSASQAHGQNWMTRDQDNLDEECVRSLSPEPPGEWVNLPQDAEPVWETRLVLHASGGLIYALALKIGGESRLLLSPTRNANEGFLVNRGEWSGWIRITLQSIESARSGHLRFKVMEFDVESRRLRLYQTQAHQEDSFTRPEAVAGELRHAVGPFVEWTESYDRLQGWIDDQTQMEIYEQHVSWMCQAARYLLRNHPWDLFMTQVHFLDMAYHIYWGAVDPEHPDYDPGRAPFYWSLLGRVHHLADQFLGTLLAELGDDTLVVVLGDHGHDLYHTNFMANHLLLREGFMTLYRDPRTGESRIDWSRTRAYASSYRIFLNVHGREPQGVVPPSEYHAVQEQIIQALERARDPRTGASPVRMALRRDDAQALGLYGGSMGDVIFAMAPGFQTRSTIDVPGSAWAGRRLKHEELDVYKQTRLFREFTGEHDTASPFTKAIRTLMYMSGPGIKPGRPSVPVRMVDIAPTLCQYLGIPMPAHCEGNPLVHPFSEGGAQHAIRNDATAGAVPAGGPGVLR